MVFVGVSGSTLKWQMRNMQYLSLRHQPRCRLSPGCCDLRLLLLRDEVATSELIPGLRIGRTQSISNQVGLPVVYIASCILSEMKKASLLLYSRSVNKLQVRCELLFILRGCVNDPKLWSL